MCWGVYLERNLGSFGCVSMVIHGSTPEKKKEKKRILENFGPVENLPGSTGCQHVSTCVNIGTLSSNMPPERVRLVVLSMPQ